MCGVFLWFLTTKWLFIGCCFGFGIVKNNYKCLLDLVSSNLVKKKYGFTPVFGTFKKQKNS